MGIITNAITSPGQLSQSHNQKFYLALTLQEQEQQDGQPSHRGAIQISPASHMGVYPPCNLLPPSSNLVGQAKTQPRADFGYSPHPHRLAAWHSLRPLHRFQSKESGRRGAQNQP